MKSNKKRTISTDVKNFVIVMFTIALVVLLFMAVIKWQAIFEKVFILFTNLCTAVFTYSFTKTNENLAENNNTDVGKEE